MSTVFHNILRAADKRYARRFAVLGAVFLAVLLGSLLVGRYALSPGQLVHMLWTWISGGAADWPISDDKVVFAVRLPRVVAAALVGAALAVSGAAYQGMFRNPMVSPDILGASTGAGFGAAVAILLGAGYFGISAAAFCCGLLAVAAAWLVSRLSKADQAVALILAGMMISSLFSAGTSFVKLVADTQQQLPAITYWLMGSLSSIKDKDVVFLAIPVALGMIPLFFLRWRMNLLTVGEEEAQSMGVNTRRLRGAVIVCATLLTSASVAVSGMIGWVGLVVAGFILFSGVKSARETISPLLGQPPEKEFVDRIESIVLSHPAILGLHDLVVHDYGPGRVMVSLHAEVPAHGDLLELHDIVDNIEMDLSRQLNCQAVIHMDPVVTDDGLTGPLRSRVAELVKQVDPAITIHDFRVVAGPTHTNLVFDAVVPFDEKLTAAQAADKIRTLVRSMDDGRYFAVVKVENSYIG